MRDTTAYRAATALAVATALFLLWGLGALGVLGVEGDPADLMYLAVLAVAIGGAVVARLRPDGMARAMTVTSGAVGVVAVIALLLGKHEATYSSVPEILGLNAMFAGLFAGAAWLFRRAATTRRDTERSPS